MTLTDAATATADRGAAVTTVASLARGWAERTPRQVAMREKDFGIWNEYTWEQTWGLIEDVAHGLLALGVAPGDRVSIHCEDRPEWIILDLATVAVRGITVGLYPTNPTSEVEYMLTDSGARIHLAEDQEQADKVFRIDRQRIPDLQKIIFVEPRGLVGNDDDRLLFWDNFLDLGREHKRQHPEAVDATMKCSPTGTPRSPSTSSSTTRTGSPAGHRTRTT
jgi:long-chain acyl-CoA synthetase